MGGGLSEAITAQPPTPSPTHPPSPPHQPVPNTTQQARTQQEGIVAAPIDDTWEHLANTFPQHPGGSTIKWIPKVLSKRYATVRLQILSWSMDAETSRITPHRIEAWSRLAQLTPFLLLHEDLQGADPSKEQTQAPAKLKRKLIHRLSLAEQGRFT